MTVLLIERDEAVRSVVARALAFRNLHVIQAATAADAMTICWRNRIHILVLDVGSLEEEALDTIRAIKAGQPEAKVLLLTEYDRWTVSKQYVGLTADNALLQKPCSLDLLAAVIQRLTATKSSIQQDQGGCRAMGRWKAAALRGVVKWFDDAKGYGFIRRPDGSEVFCHFSSIQMAGHRTLRQGEIVEFEIIQGEKGPQADQVVKVERGTTTASRRGGDTEDSSLYVGSRV